MHSNTVLVIVYFFISKATVTLLLNCYLDHPAGDHCALCGAGGGMFAPTNNLYYFIIGYYRNRDQFFMYKTDQ